MKQVILHQTVSDTYYLMERPDLPLAIRRNNKVYLLGFTKEDNGYVALIRKGEGAVILDGALLRYCLMVHIFMPLEPIRVKGVVEWITP